MLPAAALPPSATYHCSAHQRHPDYTQEDAPSLHTSNTESRYICAGWQIYGVPDLLDLESRSLRSQNSGILGSLDSAIWAMVRKVNPIFCSPDKRRRSLKKNAKRAHSHWIVTTHLFLIQGVFSLYKYKHRKNCECCPVSQLIVR